MAHMPPPQYKNHVKGTSMSAETTLCAGWRGGGGRYFPGEGVSLGSRYVPGIISVSTIRRGHFVRTRLSKLYTLALARRF